MDPNHVNMDTYDYKMFMAHLPLDSLDYLEETIQEYDITDYVICHETEPYSHFHFIVKMASNSDYHNFKQRVFIKKYGLSGKAKDGKPRQYGKVTQIQDIEKAISYTLKELKDHTEHSRDKYLRTNMSQDKINDYIEKCFKKNDLNKSKQVILKELDKSDIALCLPQMYHSIGEIEMMEDWSAYRYNIISNIISICIKNDFSIAKTAIQSYYLYWIKKTTHLNEYAKIKLTMDFHRF